MLTQEQMELRNKLCEKIARADKVWAWSKAGCLPVYLQEREAFLINWAQTYGVNIQKVAPLKYKIISNDGMTVYSCYLGYDDTFCEMNLQKINLSILDTLVNTLKHEAIIMNTKEDFVSFFSG